VRYENPVALYGGEFGTKFHEYFARNCKGILHPGGFIVLEFEPFQKKRLEEVFTREGWKAKFVEDFAGKPRILIVYK